MSAPIPTAYRIGLVAWAALVVLQLIWHGWLFPAQTMPVNGRVTVSSRPEPIRSSHDTLFTSGTLGRYSKALHKVLLVLAITVIPLLLPLFAIRDVRRALLWVGILSLFYFCHGIAEVWSSPDERWLGIIEIILTLVLIGTLGAGVKRKRKRKA